MRLETTHLVLLATPLNLSACLLTGRLDRHWFRRQHFSFYNIDAILSALSDLQPSAVVNLCTVTFCCPQQKLQSFKAVHRLHYMYTNCLYKAARTVFFVETDGH